MLLDLRIVLSRALIWARQVGAHQLAHFRQQSFSVTSKSTSNDFQSSVDIQSDAMLIALIQQAYPDHAILSEESGYHANHASSYVWIIDPLDGTTNYVRGLPIFSVSIALAHANRTLLGIVHVPALDETFHAIRGQGAFLNHQPIRTSHTASLSASLLATGLPYDHNSQAFHQTLAFLSLLLPRTAGLRRSGSAAYDLACVAAGSIDIYLELNLQPWDCRAGILLVAEAGGSTVETPPNCSVLACANSSLLAQCNQLIPSFAAHSL